jgi:MFS family permease
MGLSQSAVDPRPHPVNGSPRNTLVPIMFFAAGIVFLDRFGITYLFPEIGPQLGLDNSQLGSLASVTAVAWAISSVVFSVLSDRFGGRTKPIIVTSLVLFSVVSGLVGLASNYETMLLLRALVGICEGPVLPLVQAAVARRSSPQRRGRDLGIVIAGVAVIGQAAAPGIMVGLAGTVGWRLSFPVTGLAGVIVAVFVAVFMKPDALVGEDVSGVRVRDFRLVIANRNILLALVGSIVCIGWTVGFGAFAPQFLASERLTPATSALVLTVLGIATAAGSVVAAIASDRFGRKAALFVAAICMGLLPLFFVLFVHAVTVLLICLVAGLMAGGALNLITYVVPGESVPAQLAATAFSVQIAAGELVGGAIGPQVGGAIADATGHLANALLLYAAAPILLVVVALLLRETAPGKLHGGASEDGREQAARSAAAGPVAVEDTPAS